MPNRYWIIVLAFLSAHNNLHTELVDIGSGRTLFIECQGNGLPTVVFVSGRSDRADIWHSFKSKSSVFGEVAKFTRACAYDRPGTITITEKDTVIPSRSSTVKQPTTPKHSAEDLHALLLAAHVPPPYVLVGHSYAGLIVRLYASSYPEEVVGLVLIDTLTEFLYDALTPDQQELWIHLNSNYSPEIDKYTVQERIDFKPSFDEMHRSRALSPMPVVILTADKSFDFKTLISQGILPKNTPLDFESIVFNAHIRGQERLTERLHAKHITKTHAGHYIQTEQPQLVIKAIRSVVDKVRKLETLK